MFTISYNFYVLKNIFNDKGFVFPLYLLIKKAKHYRQYLLIWQIILSGFEYEIRYIIPINKFSLDYRFFIL